MTSPTPRPRLVPLLVAAILVPLVLGVPVAAAAPAPDPAAQPEPDPSIHYREALAHATDVLVFEPGDRVSVPFRPRPDDRWPVDGRAPRALPAGNASGVQMRAAPRDALWSVGPPVDLEGVDQPGDGAVLQAAQASTSTVAGAAWEPQSPVGENGLRREVFGFLPYWEVSGSVDLDYTTLSTIAYFSVGATRAGNLKKTESDGSITTGWAGWTSSALTAVINAAHQAGTRVVLTVSCFAWSADGKDKQAALLGSSSARANLAKQIAAAVRDRGADGVNLDFEPLVSGYADEFTALVRSVRSELNKVAPGYQLTFDTTGYIGNYPIEDATAPGGADAIFIMGYDYRGAGSNIAGSISPLTGPAYDLTDTVKAYAARVPASKLILGVPYYGRAWSTTSDALNAKNVSGTKYGESATVLYKSAASLAAQHGRRWDAVEQAPWLAHPKETCTATYGCVSHWRQVYYDDATSLKLRYDLVNRQGLRGAGIWALNYDKGRTELRKAIADKFLDDKTPPIAGTATLDPSQRDEGFEVTWTSYDDSTVTGYDVQASVDGGAWSTWLAGTTATSAIYLGAQGHTYAFRVRARDSHGNVSAWKSINLAATVAPASLTVGGFAAVLADGLRMRTNSDTSASVMTTLDAGDALHVIGGPEAGDGYTWYQVVGPIRQWDPVDPVQVGGWVAASGNGVTNLAPRTPVWATTVAAGLHGLAVNGGSDRVLSPNGDGTADTVRLAWANALAFDALTLRILRPNGTLVGTIAVPATSSGPASFDWDGRIDGTAVPDGAYVPQLVGTAGGTTYSAPSAVPVGSAYLERFGIAVAAQPATKVTAFGPTTATLTKASSVGFAITFAGPVSGLSAGDFSRAGTATGCTIGAPSGSGGAYTLAVSGCSSGTLALTLRAGAVRDVVANPGPAADVAATTVRIDRIAPAAAKPVTTLRTGVSLGSSSTTAGLAVRLSLAASDAGGAGVGSFDVARSVNGKPFKVIASAVAGPNVNVWLTPGKTYRFEVRARDAVGNVGSWAVGPTLRPRLVQQTSGALRWKGSWHTTTSSGFSGGSVRYTTAGGAVAKYTFTGRGIALVTTLAATRGAVKVYLDGAYVTTLDLSAPGYTARRLAFSRAWSASATHTIKLVAVGTAGRPRVDVDAFAVLR